MNHVEPTHGSLTLSSIGFQTETEAENRSKSNKVKSFGSPSENLKSKGKPFDTNEKKKKAFRVVEKQQMEFAPFAAKSFSEFGLPHVLIESLEEEGFIVPTEAQSSAVPFILNNRDVIIQSYTGSGKTLAYLLPILSLVGPLRVKGDDGEEYGKKLGIEAAGRTGRLGRNGIVLNICEEPEVFVVKKLQKQLGIPIASLLYMHSRPADVHVHGPLHLVHLGHSSRRATKLSHLRMEETKRSRGTE